MPIDVGSEGGNNETPSDQDRPRQASCLREQEEWATSAPCGRLAESHSWNQVVLHSLCPPVEIPSLKIIGNQTSILSFLVSSRHGEIR
jgi:hypothetical protein